MYPEALSPWNHVLPCAALPTLKDHAPFSGPLFYNKTLHREFGEFLGREFFIVNTQGLEGTIGQTPEDIGPSLGSNFLVVGVFFCLYGGLEGD